MTKSLFLFIILSILFSFLIHWITYQTSFGSIKFILWWFTFIFIHLRNCSSILFSLKSWREICKNSSDGLVSFLMYSLPNSRLFKNCITIQNFMKIIRLLNACKFTLRSKYLFVAFFLTLIHFSDRTLLDIYKFTPFSYSASLYFFNLRTFKDYRFRSNMRTSSNFSSCLFYLKITTSKSFRTMWTRWTYWRFRTAYTHWMLR